MKKEQKANTYKQVIFDHVNNNIKEYIIVVIFLFIGILLGIFFVNQTSIDEEIEISQYINSFISSLKENNTIDTNNLFKESLINNLLLALLLWFVGSTVIGIPIVCGIITFKGFSLSYTISSIIATLGNGKGILFSLITMFIHNIFFIPAILALAVSGIKLYKSIMKDKRKENIKLEVYRHTLFSLFMCIFLVISSLLEVYVSTNLITMFVKYF